MRSLSLAYRRRQIARLAGPAARRPGAGSRCLLYGALLLFGLTGALGARANELSPGAGADPRPGVPAGPGAAAALAAPLATLSPRAGLVDQASVCQALAEASAGTTAAIGGATALPAGTFRGFAGDLPTAAEPPPPGASPLPPTTLTASQPIPSAAGAAAAPPAVAPKPVPEPHPALAFDDSLGVPRQPFGKLIYQIARNYALNPLLVAAIAKVESDFNPRARSRKGACGLMQVLPSTARRFGLPRKRDLFNPRKNLEAASRYLRWLVDRFGDDPVRVLAAYNAGEGAVDRFGGVPPFSETRDYVQRIFGLLGFSVLLESPVTAMPAVAAAASALAGAR